MHELEAEPNVPPARTEGVAFEQWLDAHRIPQHERQKLRYRYSGSCIERSVGEPTEVALQCDAWEHVHRGSGNLHRVRTRYTLYAAREGRLHTLLDVIEDVRPTDSEDWDAPAIVALELVLAPDARSATLRDAPGGSSSCDATLPALSARAQAKHATAWDRFDLELARHACDQRGTFTWRAGGFVRDRARATPHDRGSSL